MSQRIAFLDTARGFAIFMVVLGHAIQYTMNDFDRLFGYRLIYAVHMPLFMFMSGYVATTTAGDWSNRRLAILAKGKQLLVPFFVWIPVSYLAIVFVQQPADFEMHFGHFLVNLARRPDAGGLWFLLVLFECQLLFLVASAVGLPFIGRTGIAILIALNVLIFSFPGSNWLGFGLLRWYFLFFFVGFMARSRDWRTPGAGGTLICLICFLVLANYWYRKSAVPIDLWLGQMENASREIAVQGYHATVAFVGIGALLGIFAMLARLKCLKSVNYILNSLGTLSLEIYAGHYLFMYIAIELSATWQLLGWIKVFFVALTALIGALLLRRLLTQVRVLSTLFYGR